MNSVIYKITHVASGKGYVGSTGNKSKRWSEHRKMLREGRHHSRHLQNAWDKFGESSFAFDILEHVEDVGKLVEREQFWIDALAACECGYNICQTAGSPRGVKHSAETKAKVSAAGTGRKLSPEHCALISVRAKERGMSHCHTPEVRAIVGAKLSGIPRPEAVKLHLSKKRTGMKFPPEWCAAISTAMTGRKRTKPMSPETRAKHAAAQTGKTHSAESKKKMSDAGTLRGAPKISPEGIARGAAKRTGAKRTDEQKERMRIGRLSVVNPHIGVKHSPERIASRVAARARNKALKQFSQSPVQ